MAFRVAFLAVNLHMLRNALPIVYLPLYGLVFFLVLVDTARDDTPVARRALVVFGGWVAVCALGAIVTFFNVGLTPAVTGFSRLIFALPVLLAFAAYCPSPETAVRAVKFMVGFFVIAAATMPMQLILGPVSWFAAEGERAGFIRFGSLLGSLTAFGIVAGCYLILSALYNSPSREIVVLAIVAIAFISLSKAALANVAIGIAALVWINRERFPSVVIKMTMTGAALVGALSLSSPLSERLLALGSSFGFDNQPSVRNYDQSVTESAWARLTDLPLANFEALAHFREPLVYVVGGGFGMGDTALVSADYSSAPMAHNQFVEVLTVFGALPTVLIFASGIALIGALRGASKELRGTHRVAHKLVRVSCAAVLLLLLNSFFANGTLYQPAAASILFLAVYVALGWRQLVAASGRDAVSV
ncbi:hypothetical protein [Nocardioides abyssi]|uniref:O-antigen ligase family protein n=1 Tax=Nocardioides abyssi TaxID=3058370 RepID=A0ABT8EYN3_9ACTN|nr:hypothetical protein [Nocardioides abyssi]MDN4163300.1 hypothetical protein [Nocardioides abyssi]